MQRSLSNITYVDTQCILSSDLQGDGFVSALSMRP